MLANVTFQNMELLEKTSGTVIPASCIAGHLNTTIALEVRPQLCMTQRHSLQRAFCNVDHTRVFFIVLF